MEKVILHEGKYLRTCRKDNWEYVERVHCTGVVVILPVTDQNETIFVEQYRYAADKRLIEFPAGLVGDAGNDRESLETAAARELEEETGYHAARLTRVLEGPTSAGLSSEMLTFFLATGLEKQGAGGGDETESIEVHLVPLDAADVWLAQKAREAGVLVDVKVYTGLYWINKYLKR